MNWGLGVGGRRMGGGVWKVGSGGSILVLLLLSSGTANTVMMHDDHNSMQQLRVSVVETDSPSDRFVVNNS